MKKRFGLMALAIACALPAHGVSASGDTASSGSQGRAPRVGQVAQLTIQFGVSDELVLRVLTAQGYDDIKIVYRGMTKARVQACRNGERYQMEITPRGEIQTRDRIGDCRRPVDLREARRLLERDGYRNIEIDDGAGGFTAIACRGRDRYRIVMDRFGARRDSQELGRCGESLSPEEIAILARALGYTRVRIVDRRPPRYVVEACREDDRVEMVFAGNGTIRDSRRIGRCDPPVEPRQIPRLLADRGLTRIQMIDERPPRYLARACRGEERLEVALDRFGEIVEERRIGRCAQPVSREQIVERLYEAGLRHIRIVERDGQDYVAEVCEGQDHLRLRISAYGETLDERRLGKCVSPGVDEVMRQFEGRGLSGAKVYVEGCRRGTRIRIELDAFGDPVDSDIVGRCR